MSFRLLIRAARAQTSGESTGRKEPAAISARLNGTAREALCKWENKVPPIFAERRDDSMLPSCRIKRQLPRRRRGIISRFFLIGVLFFLRVGLTAAQVTPLTIGASLLPEGEVNVAYNGDLAISGGIPPYTVTFLKGAPPAGLNVDNTGAITGTPTPLAKNASFTV